MGGRIIFHTKKKLTQKITLFGMMFYNVNEKIDLRTIDTLDLRTIDTLDLRTIDTLDLRIIDTLDLRIIDTLDLCLFGLTIFRNN